MLQSVDAQVKYLYTNTTRLLFATENDITHSTEIVVKQCDGIVRPSQGRTI